MYLVGGGGMLRGLAERIQRETQVPVNMSPQPLEAVVLGAGHCIENYQALRGMFMGPRR
jgi:rod shape-determining protein MreB